MKKRDINKKNNISKLVKSDIKTYAEFCKQKEAEKYALTEEEIEYYTSIGKEEKEE